MSFDPSQPRVPAGQPGGGRWIQAQFGTYEESVSDVVEQLRAAMESGEHKVFGLRVEDIDSPGAKGDDLQPSRVWKNGNPTTKRLSGTSTFGLASADKEGVEKAFKAMGLKDGGYEGYFGKVIYIVGGSSGRKGQDRGEVIIKGAKIVSVYTRDDDAFAKIDRRL